MPFGRRAQRSRGNAPTLCRPRRNERAPPRLVRQVPRDRLSDASFERLRRLPAKLVPNAAGVDRVGIRTFVDDLALGLKSQESMGKPNGDEQLEFILGAKFGSHPLSISGRFPSTVHRYVEDPPADATRELGLRSRRSLEMQPAQSIGRYREGMVVLHEGRSDTELREGVAIVALGKPATRIAMATRLDELDGGIRRPA